MHLYNTLNSKTPFIYFFNSEGAHTPAKNQVQLTIKGNIIMFDKCRAKKTPRNENPLEMFPAVNGIVLALIDMKNIAYFVRVERFSHSHIKAPRST